MVLLINHYYYYYYYYYYDYDCYYYFVMTLIKRYFPQRGDECGRAVKTWNSRTGVRGSNLARRVVSLDKELYSNLSLLRGNPAMD